MDAEMVRDIALQSGGLLVQKIGGPSVKPYQPPNIWEQVSYPTSDTVHYVQDHGEFAPSSQHVHVCETHGAYAEHGCIRCSHA